MHAVPHPRGGAAAGVPLNFELGKRHQGILNRGHDLPEVLTSAVRQVAPFETKTNRFTVGGWGLCLMFVRHLHAQVCAGERQAAS